MGITSQNLPQTMEPIGLIGTMVFMKHDQLSPSPHFKSSIPSNQNVEIRSTYHKSACQKLPAPCLQIPWTPRSTTKPTLSQPVMNRLLVTLTRREVSFSRLSCILLNIIFVSLFRPLPLDFMPSLRVLKYCSGFMFDNQRFSL